MIRLIGMVLPIVLATAASASAKDCMLSQEQTNANAKTITCVYACDGSKPTKTIKLNEKCQASMPQPESMSTGIKAGGAAAKPK